MGYWCCGRLCRRHVRDKFRSAYPALEGCEALCITRAIGYFTRCATRQVQLLRRQREIAEILIEECAEVTQRATKLLRFGVDEVQPGQPLSNKQRLSREIGDLMVMIESAIAAGIADARKIELGKEAKRQQLVRFLQTHTPKASEPTPVTPILIEAPNVYSLREEGYEVRQVSREPEDLGIPDDDDGPTGDAIVDAWEPPKPEGDGWILHFKGWMEDGKVDAVWARRKPDDAAIDA